MWGNLANNIANNASKFLEQLDETVSDNDEQYQSDGSSEAILEDPAHSQVKNGESQAASSKQTVSAQPVGTASMKTIDPIPPPPSGPVAAAAAAPSSTTQAQDEGRQQEKLQQGQQKEEIVKLQMQLKDLKGERENLKSEVSSQLQTFTSEMHQSIGSLAASAKKNDTPGSGSGGDAELKQQLKEAEDKLVAMSRAQTVHNQELEATIASLQEQVVEQRSYGNMKAEESMELKKRLSSIEQQAKQQVEEKAVGEALLKDELKELDAKWYAQKEVLEKTQAAVDQYIQEVAEKENAMNGQAEDFQAEIDGRDEEIAVLKARVEELYREQQEGDSALATEDDEFSREESKALIDTLDLKREEIEHMSLDIERSRRQSQDLSHQLEVVNSEREKALEDKGQELQRLEKALEEKGQELQRLEKALDDLNNEAAAKIGALEQEREAEKKGWHEEMEHMRTQWVAKVDGMAAQAKEGQASLEQAQQQLSAQKQQSDKQAAHLQASLDKERRALQEELQRQASGAKGAEEATAQLRQALNEANTAAEQRASEIEALRAAATSADAAAAKKEKETVQRAEEAEKAKADAAAALKKATERAEKAEKGSAMAKELMTKVRKDAGDRESTASADVQRLQSDLEMATARIEMLQDAAEEEQTHRAAALQREAEQLSAQASTVSELEQRGLESAQLEQTVQQLQEACASAEQDKEALETKIAESAGLVDGLKAEVAAAEKGKAGLASQLTETGALVDRLKAEVGQSEKRCAQEVDSKAEAQRRADDLVVQLEEEQAKVRELERQGSDARASSSARDEQVAQLEQQCAALSQQVKQASQEAASSQQKLGAATEQATELTKRLHVAEGEVAQVRATTAQDSQAKDSEILGLAAGREQDQQALSALQAQLEEALQSSQQNQHAAATELQELRRSLEGKQQELGALRVAKEADAQAMAEVKARAHHGWNVVRRVAGTMSDEDAEAIEAAEMATLATQRLQEQEAELTELRTRAHHGWNVLKQIAGTMSEEEADQVEAAELARLASQRLQEQERLHIEKDAALAKLQGQAEELESESAARMIENATLREELAGIKATAAAADGASHEQVQALQQQLGALRGERDQLARGLEETQARCEAVGKDLEEVSAQAAEAEQRAQDSAGVVADLREQLAAVTEKSDQSEALRGRLVVAEEETSAALEKVAAAEERTKALEDKKKRDLDFLKQQNQKIAEIQMERAQIIDAAEAAEEQVKGLRAQLDACVPKEEADRVVLAAEQSARALDEEKQLSEALRKRLQEMVASEAGRSGEEEDMQDMRAEHATQVAALRQEVDRLAGEISASAKAGADSAEHLTSLQVALAAEKGKAEKSQQVVAALERERIRLETELSESIHSHAQQVHQMPTSPQTAVQRQRGSVSAAYDLESGGGESAYDGAEEERKGSAAMSALVARSLNVVWALAAKYAPAALPVIGEKPPRLGLLGQGVLVYMVVLHVLVLTRII